MASSAAIQLHGIARLNHVVSRIHDDARRAFASADLGGERYFIASGHFRSGLFLSTATAVLMSELMRGKEPQVDLAPFRVGR